MKYLIDAIDFLKVSPIKVKLREHLETGIKVSTLWEQGKMVGRKKMIFVEWTDVDYLVGLNNIKRENDMNDPAEDKGMMGMFGADLIVGGSKKVFSGITNFASAFPNVLWDIKSKISNPFENVSKEVIIKEFRFRIYKLMKREIMEKHEMNECRDDVARTLIMLCDICMDNLEKDICFREHCKMFTGNRGFVKIIFKLQGFPVLGKFLLSRLSLKVEHEYQLLENLVNCGRKVIRDMNNRTTADDYKEYVYTVLEELAVDVNEIERMLESFLIMFGALVGYSRTRIAAHHLINFQIHEVEHLMTQGLLDHKEMDMLERRLDKRKKIIEMYKPKKVGYNKKNFKSSAFFKLDFPLFAFLDLQRIQKIMGCKNTYKNKSTPSLTKSLSLQKRRQSRVPLPPPRRNCGRDLRELTYLPQDQRRHDQYF